MMFNAGDLSLTQFAVLGLWVARKHHLPVDRSLLLAEAFVRSCQAADGGWAYSGVGRLGMGTTDSMTCSGLMELAVGRAVGQSQGGKTELADPQFEKGIQYLAELFDRGVVPPKPGDAKQTQNLQQAIARLQPLAGPLVTPVFPGEPEPGQGPTGVPGRAGKDPHTRPAGRRPEGPEGDRRPGQEVSGGRRGDSEGKNGPVRNSS